MLPSLIAHDLPLQDNAMASNDLVAVTIATHCDKIWPLLVVAKAADSFFWALHFSLEIKIMYYLISILQLPFGYG